MGKRRAGKPSPAQITVARRGLHGRHQRKALSLPIFAFFACFALIMAPAVDPTASIAMTVAAPESFDSGPGQTFMATDDAESEANRGDYKVTTVEVAAPSVAGAPAAGVPDPGSAKAIALGLVQQRGWNTAQYDCLVALWGKESGWNVYAFNAGSGAYGIPQAVPGNKMATVASDWKTNPKTQIIWGLGYIQGRYVNPCGAWNHSQTKGWY